MINAHIGQGPVAECSLLMVQGKNSEEGINGCVVISAMCVKQHLCDHQDSNHFSFHAIEQIIDVDCVPCLLDGHLLLLVIDAENDEVFDALTDEAVELSD